MRLRGGVYPQDLGIRAYPFGTGAGAAGFEWDTYFLSRLPLDELDEVGDILSVLNGATTTIQPSGSDTWVITHWAADTGSTTLMLQAFDGTDSFAFDAVAASADGAVVGRGTRIPITNSAYLRYSNSSGATRIFAYDGFDVTNYSGFTVIAGIQSVAGSGGTWTNQPASGKVWCLTEWGNASGGTDTYDEITDGATPVKVLFWSQANNTKGRGGDLWLTNSIYRRTVNNNAAAKVAWYFGFELDASKVTVITDTLAVASGGTTVDVQPPVGETWNVTIFCFDRLASSITQGQYDGTDYLQADGVNYFQHRSHILMNNSRYMRFVNNHGSTTFNAFYTGFKVNTV